MSYTKGLCPYRNMMPPKSHLADSILAAAVAYWQSRKSEATDGCLCFHPEVSAGRISRLCPKRL